MRRWKKELTAAALCAALLLALSIPASGATPRVNLMAVNETVLVEVTPENMPRSVGGVLYVPYTMLSRQYTGINLGVNAMYSATRRTLVVTDRGQRGIVFDLRSNTAQDMDGNPVAARAMVRNATVFVPIDYLCSYFGTIACTRTRTPHGTLIRVTSDSVILSEQDFVSAADSQLASSLRHYLKNGGTLGDDPPPSGGPDVSAAPEGAPVYLALRCGALADDCARLVEGRGQRALFLFTPEELARECGLVRRVVGAGHTAGLTLEGDDLESCLAEARRGRELLAAAARYNALVVSAPNLDEAERQALEGEGFVVWAATAHGEDYSSGGELARALDAKRESYVEIGGDERGVSVLRGLLAAAGEENRPIYQATAPALWRGGDRQGR